MKTPSIGTLSFGFVGATVVLLLSIGAPNSRVAPPPAGRPSRTTAAKRLGARLLAGVHHRSISRPTKANIPPARMPTSSTPTAPRVIRRAWR